MKAPSVSEAGRRNRPALSPFILGTYEVNRPYIIRHGYLKRR